jgi:L-lactate dehydrogenase complex protein LldG
MSARDEVLARVRAAIGPPGGPAPPVPREYLTHTEDEIEAFIDRLHHYQARTRRVAAAHLADCVRATLRERGIARVVAPEGIPDSWLKDAEPLRDAPRLDPGDLDRADGVLTTCSVAVAQSGTIILDGGAGMGRRILSLLPDYHLCVVRADQLVSSLPEAIARLDPVRPLTFISGPSATVDIEMVRVGGVHGPRRLEVIVAEKRNSRRAMSGS